MRVEFLSWLSITTLIISTVTAAIVDLLPMMVGIVSLRTMSMIFGEVADEDEDGDG